VREEDEEESATECSGIGNELKVTSTRREATSDGVFSMSMHERSSSEPGNQTRGELGANSGMPSHSRTKIVVSVDATLAQKLKQMEKGAKIDEDTLSGLKELEIGKLKPLPSNSKNPVLTHRRTKLNKIRTPSCSSSEASDDDTKTRNKKKINKFVGDTPVRFRMHRRDSHDDSSDSQDQLYPPPGSASGAANFISKSGSVSGKKEGQSQYKEVRFLLSNNFYKVLIPPYLPSQIINPMKIANLTHKKPENSTRIMLTSIPTLRSSRTHQDTPRTGDGAFARASRWTASQRLRSTRCDTAAMRRARRHPRRPRPPNISTRGIPYTA